MTFVIASIVVFLTFIVGALLAWVMKGVDNAVVKTNENIENTDKAYNPALTMGYRINSKADAEDQIKEARRVSAKQAAALPRGANMRIGWKESPGGTSASVGLEEDPWTASKIAQFHGWDGAKAGIPAGGVPEASVAVAASAAPAATDKIELRPGQDYVVIEITDDMSPDEMRKARIANSKAKSAAMKKAKAASVPAAPAAGAAAAVSAVAAAPVAVGIEPPKLIVVTDDMSPDETRKARIANSKAKSAFNKSLKAAGIDPKTVEIDDQGNFVVPQAAAVGAAATQAPAPSAASAPPAAGPLDLAAMGIAAPQLTEITEDMSPDELRKARISNSKAKSAFNKSLKAAGIDPQSVMIDDSGNVVMAEGASPAPPAVAPSAPSAVPEAAPSPVPPQDGNVDLSALGITPPDLTELTDDMSPDEKRQARIANSKAKSAFNKALKEAGIDPQTVKLEE